MRTTEKENLYNLCVCTSLLLSILRVSAEVTLPLAWTELPTHTPSLSYILGVASLLV